MKKIIEGFVRNVGKNKEHTASPNIAALKKPFLQFPLRPTTMEPSFLSNQGKVPNVKPNRKSAFLDEV